MADAVLSVELQAQINQYTRNMREATNVTQQTGGKIDAIGSRITSAIAGAFSVSAIVGFGKAVLDATAEYQKFQAVLGNTLGSSALANLKLKELQDFAAKTPFGVNELTGAFVKLANSGFKPTGDEMRKLGDLASSTGKSFDQLAEAIIDAQTGEFERLKEFGVRAKDAGDSVIFTYKGVQTQVDKTSESIRNYITSLGDAEGTSGAMAKISETLGGKISNLGDSWDQMLIVVGGNTEGVFNSAIDIIGTALNSITQYNRELQLASKYKLGGGFGDALKRFAQGIATGGNGIPTQLETLGLAASTASDKVSKFVAETIRGAKNTGDFGKAIKNLKTEADRNLKNIKVPGLANAFKDIYEDGFKALQDARTNFNKELNKPSSNFGTAKKSKAVKISVPELELPDNPKKIVSDLFRKLNSINAPEAFKLKAPKGLEITGEKAQLQIGDIIDTSTIDFEGDLIIEKLEKIGENARLAIMDIISIPNLVNLGADALGQSFEAMGAAIASGENVILAAGAAIQKSFAELLSALGQQFITMGAAKVAAGILATPFGSKLVADGAGLIALGAGLKLGGGIIGGAGKSNKSSGGPTPFANGGIISGPTLGLMGEYAGAKSDPEVVAPLSKLKNLLGETDAMGNAIGSRSEPNILFEHRVEIDGNKLVVLTDRVRKQRDRIK